MLRLYVGEQSPQPYALERALKAGNRRITAPYQNGTTAWEASPPDLVDLNLDGNSRIHPRALAPGLVTITGVHEPEGGGPMESATMQIEILPPVPPPGPPPIPEEALGAVIVPALT